ncbi:MAG: hypothetical protein ACK56I_08840 [bacterium]
MHPAIRMMPNGRAGCHRNTRIIGRAIESCSATHQPAGTLPGHLLVSCALLMASWVSRAHLQLHRYSRPVNTRMSSTSRMTPTRPLGP